MVVGICVGAAMVATATGLKMIRDKRKKKVKKSSEDALAEAINRGYAELDALDQMLKESHRDEELIKEEIDRHAEQLADMIQKQNEKQEEIKLD